jgi:hypothetical protein
VHLCIRTKPIEEGNGSTLLKFKFKESRMIEKRRNVKEFKEIRKIL